MTDDRSAEFSVDDRYLYTAGGDGVSYQWDMRTFMCSSKVTVSDALNCCALATSPTGALATGMRVLAHLCGVERNPVCGGLP